ncbi:MAG TPA: cytochrome P450 [Acidimicrobiales bacterium]|nr:cytochrome P450 [Acidimicrobiales bacterium]
MGRQADHPTHPEVDLVSGEFWGRNPHDTLTWMRANAPVYWDERGQVWGVTRYHDLKHVSRATDTWSSAGGIRPGVPALPMMIDMDDPQHWARRKLVNRGFTPRRVRDEEAKIRRVCDRIIDAVCERGTCDFVWDIAAPLPLIMIGDALGVAPDDRDDLMRWSDDLLRGLVGLTGDNAAVVRAAEAFAAYTGYAGRVIDDRRAEPRDDLMSLLVHAEVDGDRLDHDSLVHESLLILIGGDETTRHVLSGGMYQLVTHPEQWRDLVADRSLLPGAVEEMLRWVTPIKNMARTATRDVELGGQVMAAGDEVLLLYPSANRDEAVFGDPFRFDIRRSPNEHVAFGFGSHFCLGNSLARLELQVMFDRLADRLPDLHLAGEITGEADLRWRAANFVSGYERMPVEFTPTAPVGAPA